MIAVHKRSGKRHLIHPDGVATRCGRIIRPPNWRRVDEPEDSDCSRCWESLGWALEKERRSGRK